MNIEETLEEIQARNRKVEADKAWERSPVRIGTIACMTYVIVAATLFAIGNDRPFVNAFIPMLGYFLSTLSLSFLRRAWMRSH